MSESSLSEFDSGAGSKRKPVARFVFGGVSVSVWQNEKGRSVSLQRAYKDKDGNWAYTGSLNESDVPKAVAGLWEAYRFLTRREQKE